MGVTSDKSAMAVLAVTVLCLSLLPSLSLAGGCSPPLFDNGYVEGDGGGDMFTARFFCNPGFTRVGKHIIKCRRGQWNAEFPVCTSMGMCDPDDFPVVPNGFKQKVRKFRGSVYKVKCNRGFSRYGPSLVHCDGGAWNTNNMPVCAGAGCDETTMGDILYGRSKRLMNGAVYEFQCDDDTTMEGSSMVYCDGASWNDTAPGCMSTAGLPSLEVVVDGVRSHDAVTAGQTVMLVCSSKGGFPDPLLNFTRNDEAVGSSREFRNTHTFIASDDDNNAVYKCLAQNELMHRPVVSEIVLNVNFGPADVSISGPDSLQLDSVSNFSCVSSVSHPPAEIHWSVTDGEGVELTEETGVQVFESVIDWESNGWITTSNIVVSPSAAHPSLTLRCTATNIQLKNKVAAKKWVQLRYAPEKVTVTGPSKILSGEVLKLSCSSSPSIPASSLYWTVRQSDKTLEYAEPESEVVQKEDGSFITESLLTVPVTNGKGHDLRVECLANNEVLGEDYRAYYHLVDILSPPSVPVISGLPDGASILPGSPKSLICSAHAGSPAATLNWYRGDQMIESEYQVRGDSVMAEITFVPRPDDTELRCEARNEAVDEPIAKTIKIAVGGHPSSSTTTSSSTSHNEEEAAFVTSEVSVVDLVDQIGLAGDDEDEKISSSDSSDRNGELESRRDDGGEYESNKLEQFEEVERTGDQPTKAIEVETLDQPDSNGSEEEAGGGAAKETSARKVQEGDMSVKSLPEAKTAVTDGAAGGGGGRSSPRYWLVALVVLLSEGARTLLF